MGDGTQSAISFESTGRVLESYNIYMSTEKHSTVAAMVRNLIGLGRDLIEITWICHSLKREIPTVQIYMWKYRSRLRMLGPQTICDEMGEKSKVRLDLNDFLFESYEKLLLPKLQKMPEFEKR
ncbi:hypothetical protein L1049_003697 [Liquidambar formosana]|uniref:Uncharacterized protein n=1 Tax=Liquidambar formosana TaxID=63359 RepID=A0AAP0WZW1_LIQFO